MGPLGARAPLDGADELWLERSLAEVVGDDGPRDVTAAVLAASPADRSAAAAVVDVAGAAAGGPAGLGRWLAAALLLLGLAVVGGVVALQRAGGDAVSAQDPDAELVVRDAAELARLLPQVTAFTLVARRTAAGDRLPDLPEYSTVVVDAAVRRDLLAALGSAATAGTPFALPEAPAELLLHVGARYVRGRLRFDGGAAAGTPGAGTGSATGTGTGTGTRNTTGTGTGTEERAGAPTPPTSGMRFGTAAFALTNPLPASAAAALRAEWQRLAALRPPARQKIQVATFRELVAAIGSDRTIELTHTDMILAPEDPDGEIPATPHAVFDAHTRMRFEIRGVRNLHLRAVGVRCRMLTVAVGDVLAFLECEGVVLEGVIAGHASGDVGCSAPVIALESCRDVIVRDCELFGCGTLGVVATASQRVRLERCEVHTCRDGVVDLRDCQDVRFVATHFRDCNVWQVGFGFRDCRDVAFVDCTVTGMDGAHGGTAVADDSLFAITMDEPVSFVRGSIRGNRTRRLANSKLLLVRDGTDEGDNGPDTTPARAGR